MTHVTCRLTAKNRDQLRNPTLGNRVWATFLSQIYRTVSVKMLFITAQSYEKSSINDLAVGELGRSSKVIGNGNLLFHRTHITAYQ